MRRNSLQRPAIAADALRCCAHATMYPFSRARACGESISTQPSPSAPHGIEAAMTPTVPQRQESVRVGTYRCSPRHRHPGDIPARSGWHFHGDACVGEASVRRAGTGRQAHRHRWHGQRRRTVQPYPRRQMRVVWTPDVCASREGSRLALQTCAADCCAGGPTCCRRPPKLWHNGGLFCIFLTFWCAF